MATPASTSMRHRSGSNERTRFSRSSAIAIPGPSKTGTTPPLKPLQPPTGTIATVSAVSPRDQVAHLLGASRVRHQRRDTVQAARVLDAHVTRNVRITDDLRDRPDQVHERILPAGIRPMHVWRRKER